MIKKIQLYGNLLLIPFLIKLLTPDFIRFANPQGRCKCESDAMNQKKIKNKKKAENVMLPSGKNYRFLSNGCMFDSPF